MEESQKLKNFIRINKLTGVFTFPDGSVQHYVAGQLHREDGPAVILRNGFQFWYRHGELGCDNGPAIVSGCGTVVWR